MQVSKTKVLSPKTDATISKNMENYFGAKKTHFQALTPFLSLSSPHILPLILHNPKLAFDAQG